MAAFVMSGSAGVALADEPLLTSIAVMTANPSISAGGMARFTAVATFSDGTQRDVSQQVTWGSAVPVVATVDGAGVAAAMGRGTTTISATQGAVSGNARLTVRAASLAVTTPFMPHGLPGVAYTVPPLAALGGSPTYTWSLAYGELPAGLSLSSDGAISGVPTASGYYTFAVQVTDAAGRAAVQALGISIVDAAAGIWPDTSAPGNSDQGPDAPIEVGVRFVSDVDGSVEGIRFYKASGNTGTHIANLWTSAGTLLASATFTGETESGWQGRGMRSGDRRHVCSGPGGRRLQ